MSYRTFVAAALIGAAIPVTVMAENGVTHERVLFGQVAAFEGPAAALGTGMKEGLLAAFNEVNAKGGVHGRRIELRARDDGYEPGRAANEVRRMIRGGDVFGLIGLVGTPTARTTQPIATAAGFPFVGPFTGAGFLRDPGLGNVVNLRATYAAETETWISHLVDKRRMRSIAIFYQDDAFGRVGLEGVTEALERRGLRLSARGTYTRNTTAVKEAVLAIRKAKPDAVVMVGAYEPVAAFIKLARKLGIETTFVNISFVGSKALARELGPAGQGVIISQVVPFPWDDSLPIVAQYHAALFASDSTAEPGFVSLEGYIVGRLAIAALEQAGPDPTHESFLKAIWAMGKLDFGGVVMDFGPGDNQGLDDVYLTEITADGHFAPVAGAGS